MGKVLHHLFVVMLLVVDACLKRKFLDAPSFSSDDDVPYISMPRILPIWTAAGADTAGDGVNEYAMRLAGGVWIGHARWQ